MNVSGYVKEHSRLGSLMLCTIYPTSASCRYAVILYILSAENRQTLSNPLKSCVFPLLNIPNSGFQSEAGRGPRRHLVGTFRVESV